MRYCFQKFSSGDIDFEDKSVPGRRMSLDDQLLRAAVESKPDRNVRKIAADMDVHSATASRHLASSVWWRGSRSELLIT